MLRIPSGPEVLFKPHPKAGYMDALFFVKTANFILQYGADHIFCLFCCIAEKALVNH